MRATATRTWSTIRFIVPTLAVAAIVTAVPDAAHAYVGPGAGLTAIGTVVALMAAIFFAVVGFVWYPVKRLMKRRAAEQHPPETPEVGPR
ncbi:hypothetical protein L1787_07015 [Acuticoccus sp. M5D2P5]|uniref:hypothetical protein n=1 Tax=Acuticoccus kalidii TaxID=2910977 RepID=UPI001F392D96|nr:hypothetical protein [Acuticoccus kalidii]MCF3933164.1 hypothetical protein [Acuticoccus kalidii]